jgi:hypothetical protein
MEISFAAVGGSSTMTEIRSRASTTSRARPAPDEHLLRALLGRQDRRVGLGLDLRDDRLDPAGRLLRALGQLADLGGDDGEAATVLPGPRRLDGGVEREQVRLVARSSMTSRMRPISWLFSPSDSERAAMELTRSAIVSMAPDRGGDGRTALLRVPQRLRRVLRDRAGGVGDRRGGGGELLDGRRGLRHG